MDFTFHVAEKPTSIHIPWGEELPCKPYTDSPGIPDIASAVSKALRSPQGRIPTEKLNSTAKVVIICDDYTRPTPCAELLPSAIDFLCSYGVKKENIHLLIGAGFHREMTAEEKRMKFGQEICESFPIHHHDALDKANLRHLGYTRTGIPIVINRLAVEADFLMGIGVVEIHPWAGFAGGAKILCPGVAGKETINRTHALPVTSSNVDIGVTHGNPFWETIHEIADVAGLDTVINVVLNKDGAVSCVKAGTPALAQAACIQEFCSFNERVFPQRADVVVTTADPKFQYWGQASIACYGASRVVKPGGTRIVLAACPEGFGDSQQEIIFYFESLLRQWDDLSLYWKEKQGVECDNSRNACAVHRHLKLLKESDLIFVTQGFPSSTPKMRSLNVVKTVEEAFELAIKKHGPQATVIAYDRGAMVLPTVCP